MTGSTPPLFSNRPDAGKDRPRLVFFVPSLVVGGAELHTVQLCHSLREKGFDCHILVHGSARSETLLRMKGAEGATFLDLRGMSELAGWLRARRALQKLRPDIVVAINQGPFIATALLRPFLAFRFHTACILHTTAFQWREQHQERMLLFLARWLDLMIYVGRRQADFWLERGLRPRQAAIIRNGIDLERFARLPQTDVRTRYAIAPDAFLITMIASFRPEKNHQELLRGFALARSRSFQGQLVLVGEGTTRPAAEALATELGLGDAVIFVGEQSDIQPFAAASDAGILCSVVETFPLSLIEFLASGVPVIAPRVGGVSEIVKEGINGLLYPSGDIEALAGALLQISNRQAREKLARRARLSAAPFALARMVREYADAFTELFRRGRKA